MKQLLDYGDQYLQKSTWKDIGIIKFCLFSFGLLAGTYIPQKDKERARIIADISFIVSTMLIMVKFFSVIMEKSE